jgi:hypothetical protein
MSYYVPPYMHDLDESGPLSACARPGTSYMLLTYLLAVIKRCQARSGRRIVFRIRALPHEKWYVSKTLSQPLRGRMTYGFNWRATFPGFPPLNKQYFAGSATSSSQRSASSAQPENEQKLGQKQKGYLACLPAIVLLMIQPPNVAREKEGPSINCVKMGFFPGRDLT